MQSSFMLPHPLRSHAAIVQLKNLWLKYAQNICTHTCACTHMRAHPHVCVRTHTCMHAHTHTYTHMHVHEEEYNKFYDVYACGFN